jgi:hypothetical protein
VAPIDPDSYRFLSAAMHDVRLWWRAAIAAFQRLEASEQAHDYHGALIAAAETLHAVALIRAWVVAVLPSCDVELRHQFERFERDHPQVRTARNVHEHAEDYESGKGRDMRLTGLVRYHRVQTHLPGDWDYQLAPNGPPADWSELVVSLSVVTPSDEPVRVNLTRVTRDAVDLAKQADASLRRAFIPKSHSLDQE